MNLKPLKNPNYRKLLTANLINRFGDSVDSIAFTWLSYEMTENASLSALVFAANILPTVLVQPFAAPIADKMKKKGIMICTDLLRGLLLSVFLLFFCLNRVSGWMFLTFTFATNLVEAFRVPAGISFVTKVLDKDELDAGINMNQTTSQICIIAGTAAGGILIAVSPVFAMALDLLSFFFSALFISLIRVQEQIARSVLDNSYWQNLKGGLSYLRKNKKFLVFVTGALLCNSLTCVLSSVMAAYISKDLHKTAAYVSTADIILTATGLIMMFFLSSYEKKIRPSTLFTWIEFGALAGLYFVLAFLPHCPAFLHFALWAGIFLIFGICHGMFSAYLHVMFVKVVDDSYLSRASGVFNSLGTLSMPLLSLVTAALVKWIEIPKIFFGTAILCTIILLLLFLCGCCKVLDMEETICEK